MAGALLALSFVLAPAALADGNVVPNPSFEQGGCGNTQVLCGWTTTDPFTSMSQDTNNPHTGSASMHLECDPSPTCDLSAGGAAHASTDPAFCAPIGPGAHQASFWYRDAVATELGLGAAFYATPDCTGSASSAGFSALPVGGGWQQATGALAAPPGTQSALFGLEVIGGCIEPACDPQPPCGCGIWVNLDDVEVDPLGDTQPPSISSFSPTSGPGDTMVDIRGANFTGATGVAFNGTPTPDFHVDSSTEVVAFVPERATSGPISVTTPFGTGTSDDSFTVTPRPPDICCAEPMSGPVGTSVDIFGSFFTGATSVTFNGVADPDFVVNSSSLITAHVPAGATTGSISVTTPGGTATSYFWFTVILPPPPTITSFTPVQGTVGTSVDILGLNFTGATAVTFNGTAANFRVKSDSELHAKVPSGATTGFISITTPSGTSRSEDVFRVVSPRPTP